MAEPDEDRGDKPAVVEWGDDAASAQRRASRLLARLRADRRTVPIVALLGGAAVVGSVLGEWFVYPPVQSASPWSVLILAESGGRHVTGMPAAGSAYFVGLFLVAACLTLTLFGAGPVRRNARLVGLASCAVLGVVLVGVTATLPDLPGPAVVTHGRGLYLAYTGVAGLALALWLATPVAAGPEPETQAAPPPVDEGDELGPDWPWRAPAGAVDDATGLPRPGPLDLTVEPAAPFVHPPDEAGHH